MPRNAITFTPIIGAHDETCSKDECIHAAVFRIEVEGYQSEGADIIFLCPFHTLAMISRVIDTSENEYRKGLYDEDPSD